MENHVILFRKREQTNWNCAIITCNKGHKAVSILWLSLDRCKGVAIDGISAWIIVGLYSRVPRGHHNSPIMWYRLYLDQLEPFSVLSFSKQRGLNPLFPREMWKSYFPLVNRDFHRGRERRFCRITFRETRNKCLIHREPCFLTVLHFVCYSRKLWNDRFITLETWSRHPNPSPHPPRYPPCLVTFEPVSHLADWRSLYSLCI